MFLQNGKINHVSVNLVLDFLCCDDVAACELGEPNV